MDNPENEKLNQESGSDETETLISTDDYQLRVRRLRRFRRWLTVAWIIAVIAGVFTWQILSMKNTAGYLKADTKNVLKSFAALDSAEVYGNLDYLEEDLSRLQHKLDNPFWRTAGLVFRRDMSSARLLASSLEKADADIFRPAAELLEACPPASAEAAEPWLDLYDRVMPSLSGVSHELEGVNFRFYDKEGKLRGYIDLLAYFTRVMELADEDFVKPAISLLSSTPVSSLKTENEYDFAAVGAYLDFLADKAPLLSETVRSIDPAELSKIDSDGSLNALCTQAVELSDFFSGLCAEVIAPVAELLQAQPLGNLSVDGGFNAALIRDYAELLEDILPKTRGFIREFGTHDFSAIDRDGKISGAVERINALLVEYEPAERYLPLLKVLMGDGEDRTYVFPVQNSAEIRSSGGFPGSVGLITIRNGVLSFGSFSGVHDFFSMYCGRRCNITEQEKYIFSANMILSWDACYCPSFERAGRIFAYATEDWMKLPVDGTVSMTPAVIQEILKLFGEVTIFDGTVLNGENATRILQRDIYFQYYGYGSTNNLYAADSFFGDCAKKVMELVRSNLNRDSIPGLVEIFRSGCENRTIMLWMADEEEQEIVKSAGCSGGLNHDPDNPKAGIYVSGFNACKLGWWLGVFPTVSEPVVNSDGTRTYDITVTVENVLTWNEYYQASVDYITSGDGIYGLFMHFFAPEGGDISDFSCSRKDCWQVDYEYEGLKAVKSTFYIAPGGTFVFSYKITTAPGVEAPLGLSMTPTLQNYW